MGQCSSSEATATSIEVSADEVVFEYTGKGSSVPKGVTIVRFHPSVVEIEYEAFCDCTKLRKVDFNGGLQKIGVRAFYNCISLSSITLPSAVTEIGYGAFQECSYLREVVLNERLQKIGKLAFWNCTSLSSITLSSNITEVDVGAFSHCNNLREIEFNKGLQKIGQRAFSCCTSLSSITLPSTVTEIDNHAFSSCRNLREVMCNDGLQKIGQYAFINCTSLERLTFPTISSRLDTLIQTGHWEDIENEVNEVRGVVEVSGSELFVSAQTMGGGNNWNTVRRDTEKIVRLVAFYESQLPILDIAFTNACDIGVPGPMKDKVLQYLI